MAARELVALNRAYAARGQALRSSLEIYLLALWDAMPDKRDAAAEAFVERAVPAVHGAQVQMATLTDGYLSRAEQLTRGVPVAAAGIDPTLVTDLALRGVPAEQVYMRPAETVWAQLAEGQPFAKASAAGRRRLTKILQTDVQLAKTHAARHSAERRGSVRYFRRELNGSKNCGLCIVASTQRYHRGDLLDIHPGCVPGDTVVEADGVLAVTRRRHAGEIVVVRTADGNEVTVTPNHPVLTDEGWVPADRVREGDHLFRHGGRHRVIDGGPAERHRPATAEDVWRAASVSGVLLKMPLAPEDLHGDGADGEIDVVWTDSHFPAVGGVTFGQPASEGRFVDRHRRGSPLDGGGALAPLGHGGLATPGCLMSGVGLLEPFLSGHLGCPELAGSTAAPRFDAPAEEFSLESAAVYASRGRDLQRRLAGQVERHRVVELRRVSRSGHVYNLHTAEGWYSANNRIVSNCDCGVSEVYDDVDPGQIIEPERLQDVHDAILETFGASSASAREIPGVIDPASGDLLKYRDVLVTHEHGEIGPVLGVRGHHFTSESDL